MVHEGQSIRVAYFASDPIYDGCSVLAFTAVTVVSLLPLLSNVPAEHQFLLASG